VILVERHQLLHHKQFEIWIVLFNLKYYLFFMKELFQWIKALLRVLLFIALWGIAIFVGKTLGRTSDGKSFLFYLIVPVLVFYIYKLLHKKADSVIAKNHSDLADEEIDEKDIEIMNDPAFIESMKVKVDK
jgi:hypothetical protein